MAFNIEMMNNGLMETFIQLLSFIIRACLNLVCYENQEFMDLANDSRAHLASK